MSLVVQWHPESLRTMKVPISRPRVYLIDFETAVQFPAECPISERVSVGFPVAEQYSRPPSLAPELASGTAYSPFKLDVWQLGYSFLKFKVWHCIFFTLLFSLLRHQVSAEKLTVKIGVIFVDSIS
jgi:serine/threonine protein kinase